MRESLPLRLTVRQLRPQDDDCSDFKYVWLEFSFVERGRSQVLTVGLERESKHQDLP